MRVTVPAATGDQRGARDVAPRVAIVVVNWNGWPETSRCLDALRRLDYPCWEVVVIDNASTDGSVRRLAELHPEAEILASAENLGFAAGSNAGIERALAGGSDYVWLLNNDALPDAGALRALVSKAEEDPQIAAVGSVVYEGTGARTVQAWGGGWADPRTGRSAHFRKPVATDRLDYITGASLLLRRQAIERSGSLDERFFLYFEDTELGFRYRRDGWRLAVAQDSVVIHQGGTSSVKVPERELDRHRTRSLVMFLRMHASCFGVSAPISALLRAAGFTRRGEFRRALRVLRDTAVALRDYGST